MTPIPLTLGPNDYTEFVAWRNERIDRHLREMRCPWDGDYDMNKINEMMKPAKEGGSRIKLFLYGDTGTTKTRSALEIATLIGGKIAVLDLERGTELYGKDWTFDVLPTDDMTVMEEAVRLFSQGGHDYRTLILDPITLLWSAWIDQWESRFLLKNAGRKGHRGEWYEMGMKDWSPIKRTWAAFMRMVVNLDMNVIITAREKTLYSGSGNSLQKAGVTFDCEKGLAYSFDTVLHLITSGAGKRMAETIKDRTGKLPGPGPAWEYSPSEIVSSFADENLAREVSVTLASPDQIAEISGLGVSLNLNVTQLDRGARKHFGVASVEELDGKQAVAMIARLKVAKNKKD